MPAGLLDHHFASNQLVIRYVNTWENLDIECKDRTPEPVRLSAGRSAAIAVVEWVQKKRRRTIQYPPPPSALDTHAWYGHPYREIQTSSSTCDLILFPIVTREHRVHFPESSSHANKKYAREKNGVRVPGAPRAVVECVLCPYRPTTGCAVVTNHVRDEFPRASNF